MKIDSIVQAHHYPRCNCVINMNCKLYFIIGKFCRLFTNKVSFYLTSTEFGNRVLNC